MDSPARESWGSTRHGRFGKGKVAQDDFLSVLSAILTLGLLPACPSLGCNHDGHRWRRALPTDTSAMAELLVRAIHILGEDGLTISGEKFYGVYPARTP